jgi:hypothetical protein
MPANWVNFKSNMKKSLGIPNEITISDLAELHATEYINAITSATIILSLSKVSGGLNKDNIKRAYTDVFTKLSNETIELTPDYKGNNFNANKSSSNDKIESIFEPLAVAICTEWLTETFTPSVTPPGYISATAGYTVIVPGDPNSLKQDLAKAFFIAQTELNQDVAFNVFITGLVLAYSKHLLKITGVFNGLIPAAPSPIAGPPLPFIGII